MRSKFQKRSALKLIDRIILHKHGYNTPQLAAEPVSKACFDVHTRDSNCEKRIAMVNQTSILFNLIG
jgi:hypothetical protein